MGQELGVGPVQDLGLLAVAGQRPATALWGQDAYATIDEKAAALLDSLVRHPALVDGNERLGWLSVVVFMAINGHQLSAPDDEAWELVTAVAGGHVDVAQSARTLRKWH